MFGRRKQTDSDKADMAGCQSPSEPCDQAQVTAYPCTTCGCLVAPDRVQVVNIWDWSWQKFSHDRFRPRQEYYCAIDALPYDIRKTVCEHETHYFQNSDDYREVEVKENGKPLPKAKI